MGLLRYAYQYLHSSEVKRFLSILPLVSILLFAACRKEVPDLNSCTAVCSQAETYYQNLMAGQYEKYLEGISGACAMLPEQRAQTLQALKAFCQNQQAQHGGMVSVRGVEALLQDKRAEVYMDIIYADSVSERIVVPMVLEDSVWRME